MLSRSPHLRTIFAILPASMSTLAGPIEQRISKYVSTETSARRSPRTMTQLTMAPYRHSFPLYCRKIQDSLQPTSLKIANDSHKHAGHSGNPSGSADAETHFRVDIVSTAFDGKNLVQRHRMIYGLLQEEIDDGVHALQLKTQTPDEVSIVL